MQNGDEASSSIILADGALLVKMVITLISHGIFFQILYYVFKHCPATGMKKCDEASPSIIFAGRALW